MERIERNEKDDAQKAKIIFLSLAAAVLILLIWSISSAGKARSERDAVKQEMETIRQDNAKLEQMIRDLSTENEALKKRIRGLETKVKAKAKRATAVKKKTSKSAKKKTSRTRSR